MARITTLILCLALCFNVLAKKHGDNGLHGNKRGKNVVVVNKKVVVERFSDNDRDIIVKFYEREHGHLPPGQLKKLPHFDFIIGQVAPPAAIKVFAPLPLTLVPLLLPPPPGFEMLVAGDQIVRVHKATRKVADVVPFPIIVPPLPR